MHCLRASFRSRVVSLILDLRIMGKIDDDDNNDNNNEVKLLFMPN